MSSREAPRTVFTERSEAVRPFQAMEIMERAQELEAAGRTICHLEVGEPDFDTPAVVVRAGCEALSRGETHYTHSLGVISLREAIAERYRTRYGVDVEPARILVTMGSSPAFLLLFASLIDAGGEVLVPSPHYSCYPNFIRFFGGRMIPVPTDPRDGYRLDPAEARKRLTSRTRALLINSPSNPTGAVLGADRLKELGALGIPVVSDEIYHGLVYEGEERSMLEFSRDSYVLDGFSKRYAMTGWRLGYLVAPEHAIRTLQKMHQNFLISATSFVQSAGIAALREAETDVLRMREVYDRRRRLMVEIAREAGFLVPVMPQGAFYVFADASRYTEDSLEFARLLLEETGVGVAPGTDYGETGRRSVRFCYATSEDTIREAGRRLGAYLRP